MDEEKTYTEQDFWRRLEEMGRVSKPKPRSNEHTPMPRRLIEARGKLASELILEDRR